MASWEELMINRLSNLINRNRSAAKISQVLCSSKYPPRTSEEMMTNHFREKESAPYVCGVEICKERKKKGMYEVFCWGQ